MKTDDGKFYYHYAWSFYLDCGVYVLSQCTALLCVRRYMAASSERRNTNEAAAGAAGIKILELVPGLSKRLFGKGYIPPVNERRREENTSMRRYYPSPYSDRSSNLQITV